MQAAAVAMNEGEYFEPSKMTLARWVEIWLKEYTGDKKYLTVGHVSEKMKEDSAQRMERYISNL